jgi:hypothetical protein
MNRRQLLGMAGIMAAGGTALALPASAQTNTKTGLRIFDVKAHGAVGDGKTLDTLAINVPLAPLPARLCEQLVLAAGIPRDTRWSALTRSQTHALAQQLARTEFSVTGKSLNQDEFVTCGGVRLAGVNFKTMESKLCPGLFFAGELLDIDGVTGGFNFQAAWTTGWLAGQAMAAKLNQIAAEQR